jgi:hypothetical protein
MWRNVRRIWLPLLAFCFSALWAFRVPVENPQFENFFCDEGNHLKVVRYIAEHRAIPAYSFDYYEAAHPPLYHLGFGAIAALSDRTLGSRDGALFLRLLNAMMGALLTFLVGEGIARISTPRVAALAAGLAGLLPGRIAVSAGVSNENLAALAGVGALAALAANVRNPARGRFALGLWTALAVGSKVTGLGLALAVLVALRPWRVRFLVVGAIAILNGPWMLYNTARYGDPYLVRQTEAIWERLIPGFADWLARGGRAIGYVRNVAFRGWESFLGAFDGLGKSFFPGAVYWLSLSIPFAGFARKPRLRSAIRHRMAVAGLILTGVSLAIFVSYNYRHFAPQGRFLFVVLLPMSWWAAEGWLALWPQRLRNVGVASSLLALLMLNVYALAFLGPK